VKQGWLLDGPVKPRADRGNWSKHTLALIERAESLGLKLAPVGREPWGWELRYEDHALIVHGKTTEDIEAALKSWPDEKPEGWTIRANGVEHALRFQRVSDEADGRHVWRTYAPSGAHPLRDAADYWEQWGTAPGDDTVMIVYSDDVVLSPS
jgi:hypothetical protein